MTLALHAATVLEESNQSLFNTQVEESHLREEQDVIIENRFGTFSVPQHQVISFSAGMLGFETYRDFALLVIPSTKANSPFRLLQSIEEAELSFIVMTTDAKTSVLYKKDVEDICAYQGVAWDRLLLLHMVTLDKKNDGAVQMTVNARAPVAVDIVSRTAQQVVLSNPDYPIRLPVNQDGVIVTA